MELYKRLYSKWNLMWLNASMQQLILLWIWVLFQPPDRPGSPLRSSGPLHGHHTPSWRTRPPSCCPKYAALGAANTRTNAIKSPPLQVKLPISDQRNGENPPGVSDTLSVSLEWIRDVRRVQKDVVVLFFTCSDAGEKSVHHVSVNRKYQGKVQVVPAQGNSACGPKVNNRERY